jgi:hypothetical protein
VLYERIEVAIAVQQDSVDVRDAPSQRAPKAAV